MEIDKVQKVHSIGHRLRDTKVAISRDFKFSVAEIQAEGRQGDVHNMPRWVAHILSENNLATMDSPDMVTELKQALSKEKLVGEYQISMLDPHFYIKLKQSMKELDHNDFDKVEGLMLDLFRMRRGKLIKMADTTTTSSDFYGRLTVEENIFYQIIHENSVDFEKQIRGRRK